MLKYIYDLKLKYYKSRNNNILQKRQLNKEKYKYKKRFKLPSTTKLMAVYLFLLLNVVIIYSLIAMWKFKDLSYLGVLITDIASQVLVYLIYSVKSVKENTKGGIVYDLAMSQQTSNDNIDDEDTDE